jgi:succinate-acetate transporter protein
MLFFLLSLADFTGSAFLKTVAGFEGIFCGASAMYTSLAQVLNEVYGKVVMPL